MKRHTAQTMAKARQFAEAGWTYSRIAGFLGAHPTTVAVWIDGKQAARRRERDRRYRARRNAERRQGRLGWDGATEEFKQQRMTALLKAGLTRPAAAKVMALDFGESA